LTDASQLLLAFQITDEYQSWVCGGLLKPGTTIGVAVCCGSTMVPPLLHASTAGPL
jgi:hypothetical protein